MKLTDIFSEAICHSDQLVSFYEQLTTRNVRAIRPEWANRFYKANLIDWPQKDELWRSNSEHVLIVGSKKAGLSHNDFSSEKLMIFLRTSMVMAMAAVDKVLHEAVSKHFIELAKTGKLDTFTKLNLSESYRIAIESRKRTGRGGKVRNRPGHKIKIEVINNLYYDTFLSLDKLQKICAACGKDSIFSKYGKSLTPNAKGDVLQKEWSRLYKRRNQIAHECDIIRMNRIRKVSFHDISPKESKADIAFVKSFGQFLAKELE